MYTPACPPAFLHFLKRRPMPTPPQSQSSWPFGSLRPRCQWFLVNFPESGCQVGRTQPVLATPLGGVQRLTGTKPISKSEKKLWGEGDGHTFSSVLGWWPPKGKLAPPPQLSSPPPKILELIIFDQMCPI